MTSTTAPRLTDPRPAYAAATGWMIDLLAHVTDRQLGAPTPCTEFDVRGLIRHVVGTAMRAEVAAAGGDVLAVSTDSPEYSAADYAPVVARAIEGWSDDGLLRTTIRVPWGEVPGAGVLWGYVNETLVHGWDLAVATGQSAQADPEVAEAAMVFATRFIPAEIRGDAHVPFGPVVQPRAGAGATERLANWTGRQSYPWVTGEAEGMRM